MDGDLWKVMAEWEVAERKQMVQAAGEEQAEAGAKAQGPGGETVGVVLGAIGPRPRRQRG